MFDDFILWLRVTIVRLLLSYNDAQERKQAPRPPPPTFTETIPSPSPRGSVRLHFHVPPSDASTKASKRPVVLDFHGGGFSSGVPSMDDRWIASLSATASTRPVVVGVDYSLAPEYPFPAALQDASAAIEYVATEGAAKYGLDPSRVVLCGFSAGGIIVLTVPLWMHERRLAGSIPLPLRGVLSVYPSVDMRIPRKSGGPSALGRFLGTTWDLAFASRSPVASPFVSPAAAGDDLLRDALPSAVALYPVALDPLCAPCETLRKRLRRLGKDVTGHVEPDAFHAWDKVPIRGKDDEAVARRWRKREEWFERMARDVDEMLR